MKKTSGKAMSRSYLLICSFVFALILALAIGFQSSAMFSQAKINLNPDTSKPQFFVKYSDIKEARKAGNELNVRIAEEGIAREEALRFGFVERYVARRVARRADDAQDGVAEFHFFYLVQIDVDGRHGVDFDPVNGRSHRIGVQHEGVLAREGEGNAVGLAQMFDAQHVVEMTVRIDRQHRFEPVFGEETVECGIFFGGGISGVDDRALLRVVPNDVGVLLYRIESQAGDFHDM